MPEPTFPTVTIGFYPRERFAMAGKVLSSIIKNTKIPFTLVIVECGTPARYHQEMQDAVAGFSPVIWIRENRLLYVNESRNRIAAATKDEFVCFIENGTTVEADCVEKLVGACMAHGAGVAAPMLYEKPSLGKMVHNDNGLTGIVGDPPGSHRWKVIPGRVRPQSLLNWKDVSVQTLFEAHCLVFSRSALEAIGPFDEDLTIGTHFETACALANKGVKVIHVPQAVATHHAPFYIHRDERAFFAFRWDVERTRQSVEKIKQRWGLAEMSDVTDFARGQRFRTNFLLWHVYKIARLPDRAFKKALAVMKGDQFVRNSALFFTLSMTAAALSYLFHPVLARLLSVEDYGEVSALLSLYGTVAIPIGIFSTIVVNIVANTDEHDHHDIQARRRLISVLRKLATVVVAVVVSGALLAAPLLGKFFQFRNSWSLVAFAATFVMCAAIFFRRAYLRGTKQFGMLGTSQIVETGTRLVLAAIFAVIGLRAVGAMFAVVLAQVGVFLFVREKTKAEFTFDKEVRLELTPEVRRELRYAGLIMVNAMVAMAISVSDVLVIKHYFSPTEAGLYGGIATVGRIVAYVTGAVTGVLVSTVRLKNTAAENGAVLRKAMFLTAALGGAALLAFAVAPSLAIELLIGKRYLASAALLPKVSLLMFLVALVSPLFSFHLALRRPDAAIMGTLAVALILALCVLYHDTPSAVVGDFITGLSLLLAALAVKSFFEKHKPHADVRA